MKTDEKWPLAAYERHARVFYGLSFSQMAEATQIGLRQRVDEMIRQQTAPSDQPQNTSSSPHAE